MTWQSTASRRPKAESSTGRIKVMLASWAPFLGGAEVAAERLVGGLLEAGHEVSVLLGTEGELSSRMKNLGVSSFHLPLCFTNKWRWWQYASVQRSLRRLIVDVQPDLIHSNDLPTHQLVSQAAGKLNVPRICHHRWIFGGVAIDWLNKFGAERHLFVSKALKDQLCQESSALDVAPCEVVYDGLPLPALPSPSEKAEAKKQLDLPDDKVIVTYAGQIIPRKGVADLLHAWMELEPEDRHHAELVILGDDLEGDGAYRQEMQRLAEKLRCPARFVGFQRNVPQWLTASDISVVPSHAEPLGNATLEAMSFGLPVIGCDVGGIPEMVVADETGMLVPPSDPRRLSAALASLLRDLETRQSMGARGRVRCEQHFALAVHVENVVTQYRMTLGQRHLNVSAKWVRPLLGSRRRPKSA